MSGAVTRGQGSAKLILALIMGGTALTCSMAAAGAIPEAAPADAPAAPEPAAPYEEIIVTAQRRASTIQNTPVSVSAVSGEDMLERGITSITTLAAATPGISLKSEGLGQTEVELRGMTSSGGNSSTVGFYLDDIPLTAPAGAQNGKVVIDPTLYDLNRMEVLRGPQGTLYGAGSMGGTVRLITNQPNLTDYHGSAQSILSGTQGGGFNHADNAMLNLPLVPGKLALRVVGSEARTSGWIDRVVAGPFPLVSADGTTRGDVQSAPVSKRYEGANSGQLYGTRATLLWQPTEDLSITPSLFYQTARQNGISAYDSDPGSNAHYQPFDIAEPSTDHIVIYSLTATYAFDDFDVSSITSRWTRRSTQVEDGSEDFNNPLTGASWAANNALPNPGYYGPNGTGTIRGKEDDPSRQFTQEVRAASRGDGPLTWVAGVYYSSFASTWTFDGQSANPSAYMDIGTFQPATTTQWFKAYSPTEMKQYAVYAEGTYALTDALKADVGLRWYSYDYRYSSTISGWGSGLGAAAPSESGLITMSENGFNPKFNLSYTFDPDLMAYATISKGFRPGGGNAQYPTTGAYWSAVFTPYNFSGGKWPSSYKSDTVWSYELGEKARLFDRRLTVNASVYYEDWQNVQLMALPGDWPVNINGNHASIYGGEIETRTQLGGGFQFDLGAGYTHARVDAGPHWQIVPADTLPDVAPINLNAAISYLRDLDGVHTFSARVETTYMGERRSLSFPPGYTTNGAYTPLPGYDITNIRAGIQSSDGWGVSLFVNNLFNTRAQLENLMQETLPSASFNRIVTNQPLTGGVDLSYSF